MDVDEETHDGERALIYYEIPSNLMLRLAGDPLPHGTAGTNDQTLAEKQPGGTSVVIDPAIAGTSPDDPEMVGCFRVRE